MLLKYRKLPVVIEAIQHSGSSTTYNEISRWMKTGEYRRSQIRTQDCGRSFEIETLEGIMTVAPHAYVIKGVQGEFYPCKPDIFKATYELA